MIVLVFMGTVNLTAQTDTGKIEGYVRDKDTGQPIAGAQVVVKGTRAGNLTTVDGYYFILNVPVGVAEVSARFTGYQSVNQTGVRIMSGHTMRCDFELSQAVIEMEAISIEAQAEPLIVRDNTMTKQRQSAEEIEAMPVASLDDVVSLQPGVVRDGERFSIRGGRVGEEAMYVDGVLVKNFGSEPTMPPILGKTSMTEVSPMQKGHNPDNSPLDVNTNAVEEITIITGGFQAEYGNAKSGVINIVTKEGTELYTGNVRFRTDGIMPQSSDFGFNELSGSLGGPVPLVPYAYFHASADAQGRADWSPKDTRSEHGFWRIDQEFVDRINSTIAGKHDRPATLEELESSLSITGFSNPARRPGAFGDRYSISEKITWAPTNKIKFLQTFNRSRNQRLSYEHRYAFRIGNNNLNKSIATNYLVGLDWNIRQSARRSSILTVRAGYFKNYQVVGPPWERGIVDRRYYGADDYILAEGQPWENESVNRNTMGGFAWDGMKTWVEKITDDPAGFDPERFVINADTTWMYYLDRDGDGKVDLPYDSDALLSIIQGMPGFHNYFTRYYDIHRGPWGIWNGSFHHNHMQVWRFSYGNDKRYTFKADWDNQINKYNRAKLGVDYQVSPMENFSTGWGTRRSTEVDNKPYILSIYGQNRLDLGDFVLDFGLRYDQLDPRGDEISYFKGGSQELLRRHTRILRELAPRLGVAFPVTDRTQVRLSFGHFYQPPSFRFLLRGDRVGRDEATLDYTKTIMFEAGITALLSDELVLDFVGYNRDIEGDFAYRYIRTADDPTRSMVALTNLDYGNVKGMNANLQYRMGEYLNARLSYTLQFARSTGTD
ncbi:MAG: carboxypeptidase regulatory-like domain-containing protein, partial [Gemmatimonadota bacterium]|nr:carboxypeptidase regulatory-like domain-containing protein [Gemmatimonadota bacterium]